MAGTLKMDARTQALVEQHDRDLTMVRQDISGLRTSLTDMSEKNDAAFNKVFAMLNEQKGKQGPGFKEILTIVLAGGGLVSMAAAAVTILVTSLLMPSVTKLETQGSHRQATLERMEEDRQREFIELRREAKKSLDDRITALEALAKWAPTVAKR